MDLTTIENPAFLKDLKNKQLEELAEQIRHFLIEKLAVTGGHVGPNLGVVELVIAMHKVFDSPKDKFIFDVGHQSYVHKILTGRADQFDTLRKTGGLSGFPKRCESEHDVFETGHSSTSISAAIGMTIALNDDDHHVIPLIGDGALTGGMAFEALNYLAEIKRPFIIILNDNEMSISKNVGGIQSSLQHLRRSKSYTNVKNGVQSTLSKIPLVGNHLVKSAYVSKNAIRKAMSLKGDRMFGDFSLDYLGPVDGHNFHDLINTLNVAKSLNHPVLVHVLTEKGRGYTPAQTDESGLWHGLGPFDRENGTRIKSKNENERVWSSVISETLEELAKIDEKIVVVSPAMIKGSKFSHFQSKFPDRIFDVGIAEQHATTFAAGLAAGGMKPFLSIYSSFLQRGYDQVIHDIALQNLNVVIGIDRAGFAGGDGATHHGIYDVNFLLPIPNITIIAPSNSTEAQNLMWNIYNNYSGPIAIRYPRGYTAHKLLTKFEEIPLGTWKMTSQNIEQINIVSYGMMLSLAYDVQHELETRSNLKVNVINAQFLKPMDTELLSSLANSQSHVVCIEDVPSIGSLGSEVLQTLTKLNFNGRFTQFGLGDTVFEQGNNADLLAQANLTVDKIVKKILEETNETTC